MSEDVRNAGHDDWLDALESGEGYYLECENGHGLLPPRRVCPHCGGRDLSEEALPTTGTIQAQTTVHVPAPSFQGDAPYTTAVVDFGAVRITGQIRSGTNDGAADVENGAAVEIGVGKTGKGERIVVFGAQ